MKWRSYQQARKFARALKLKNRDGWFAYTKSDERPDDIPYDPRDHYKKEWTSWGDFLGTGTIATQDRQFRSFTEARKFAHSLKLKKQTDWFAYTKLGKRPDDIPSNPGRTYKNKGWKGMGDFLGTGSVANKYREFRSFTECRKFAHSLQLKRKSEWGVYVKSDERPDDIPKDPSAYYKKDWKGWGDFLGTGTIATQDRQFRSFTEARKFAHSLQLKRKSEWEVYVKSDERPDDIPYDPRDHYKKEWTSWGDFLGTGTIATRDTAKNYLSAKEARIEIKKIAKEVFGGKPFTAKDWVNAHKEGKIPRNLPRNLSSAYDPDIKKRRKEWRKKK